jgi:hypothetical protein
VLAVRDRQHRALALLVGLGAAHQHLQPFGDLDQVVDVERDQLGAAQEAGEADQQQGAVAVALAARVEAGDQGAQGLGHGRGGLPAGAAAVGADDALPHQADLGGGGGAGPAGRLVDLGDGGEPAPQGGDRRTAGVGGEVGGHGADLGRQRRLRAGGAPGGEVAPVGGVGAQRGRRLGAEGVTLGALQQLGEVGLGVAAGHGGRRGGGDYGALHGDGAFRRLGHGGSLVASDRLGGIRSVASASDNVDAYQTAATASPPHAPDPARTAGQVSPALRRSARCRPRRRSRCPGRARSG